MTSKTASNADNVEQEHLEHYESTRERYKDERDSIQKKTFTKWVNKHLKKASGNINDLFVDLRDGNNLISLLEVLSDENLLRESGRTRFHRIQNIQYCLDWLKMKNIKLVNIRPDEIVEGNGKLTLGLIWTIILNFQVSVIKQRQRADAQAAAAVRAAAAAAAAAKTTAVGGEAGIASPLNASMNTTLEALEGGSAKEALLAWNQRATDGYASVRVANFTSSWRDGLAFAAILHRHRPSAIDWEQISSSSMTNRERLTIAFEVAKREFDVDKLLDPEDVDTDKPDEKSIITYVSTLYQNMPCLPDKFQPPAVEAAVPSVEAEEEEGERWAEWTERVLLVLGSTRIGLATLPEAEVNEIEGVRLALASTRIDHVDAPTRIGLGEEEGEEGGQMTDVVVVRQEIEQCRTALEAYLSSRSGQGATGDHRAELMMAELAEKWERIKNLTSAHERDLEAAANERTERLHGELASFTSWLSAAEQWAVEPAPISRLPEGLAAQRLQQEERIAEIEMRSTALAATLSLARDVPDGAHLAGQPEATSLSLMVGHDGAACAPPQAAAAKQAVNLEERLTRLKLAARERSERLATASEATTAWADGVTSINDWMETVERNTEVALPLTLNVSRLRVALEDAKSTIADVSSHRVQFEMTKKRAVALMEMATDSEKAEIEWRMEALRKRWEGVSATVDSRCAEAEKAAAEAAEFTEALANLDEWLDGELAEGAVRKEKGCRGDVDTIVDLLSSEKTRVAERKAREESIEAIVKKAASLVAAGVEEAATIAAAAARLEGKWKEMEDEGARRKDELERAMEEAKNCDEKVCSLLVWLGKLDEQLDVPSSSDLSTGLAAVGSVRAALSVERPRLQSVSEACEALLDGCHPAAEQAIQEWRRVIQGKWKQVEDRAAAKEESVIEQEERQRANEAAMDEERRAVEEHLAEVAQQTVAWHGEVHALEEWMEKAESKMAVAPAMTVDGDRLRETLQEAKSTAVDIASRKYEFDLMRGRAGVIMQIAPENERKEIEEKDEALGKRWDAMCAAIDSRCAEIEKYAAESGKFTEALANLEEWLDGELAEGAVRKEKGCRGDVDTVANMLSAERNREHARKDKAESIEAIRMKAASLVAAGVDGAAAVAAAAAALGDKWAAIEGEGARRREELERAMDEAKECDAKVYGLLGWLVDLEERLEVPAPSDRSAQLDAAGSVRAALAAERPRLEEVKEACEALLVECHPDAEQALKEWRRVVEARWREVDDQAAAREESLLEEERQRANEMAMDAAREFEERKRLELDESRWEAESVGEEIDQCADEVLASLETRKPLPGVPETAEEQMDEFMAVKAAIEQTRIAIEDYLSRTIEAASADEENWLRRNRARLEAKWGRIKDLASTRQSSLEAAAQRADQLDAELVDLRAWLQWAEQSLAEAGPISRLPAGLATQREEQEERMEEVDRRRASFLDTKSLAGQIRAACEAKDAVYIKNQTVTLDAKLAKFVGRAGERSKQLEAASHETAAWLDGVNSLDDWMEEIKSKTAVVPPTTSDVDRLRKALEEAKTTVADVCAHRTHFEHVRRAGVALMERAPKHERREIETEIGEFRKRWDAVCAAADSRCAEAEQELLEGGAFTEALANLEEWLDGELAEGAVRKEKGCTGDVDTVTELVYADRKREEARRKKAETIGAITKKAASLVAEGVEEAAAISAAAARLEGKWKEMEKEGKSRKGELERAIVEARDYDGKVRGLLDWLAEMHGRLEVSSSSSDLSAGLAAAAAVRAALGAEHHRLEAVREGSAVLLDACHPDAEEALMEWRRVVEERWKEVDELAASREKELAEEEQRLREREAKIHELNEFVEAKRLELDEASLQSAPASVEEAVFRVAAHGLFEEQLKERQADVDALTKGRRRDGERDAAADALGSRWRALWTDSIGRAAQLEKDRELQEEVKRLERWQYPEWRDRYVEWNDHGKARVNDLFRRLDRSSTGSVPRAAFIDAVIASKFPTSRLEMAKVADRFDRGDGMISGKEFIASLKIGSKVFTPKSPEEQKRMIRSEMTRRREQCCCAHKFRIDHEEDTPGRPQPKSDGGVLQTYRFGDQQIRRMVRILHTTVMVRVGGGWEPLDEFLGKHDPCKAKDRTNTAINARFYDDVRPAHATDKMYDFTKLQHARGDYGSPTVTSPAARSSPRETAVTVLKPHTQTGTPGVVKGIREKTERSVPMFGENRYSRERVASMELLDTPVSRPSSRASDTATTTPSRIPSLRGSARKPPTTRASRLTDLTNRTPAPTVPRAD